MPSRSHLKYLSHNFGVRLINDQPSIVFTLIPKTHKFSVTRSAFLKASLDPLFDISAHVLALSLRQGAVGSQQDLYSLLVQPHILLLKIDFYIQTTQIPQ